MDRNSQWSGRDGRAGYIWRLLRCTSMPDTERMEIHSVRFDHCYTYISIQGAWYMTASHRAGVCRSDHWSRNLRRCSDKAVLPCIRLIHLRITRDSAYFVQIYEVVSCLWLQKRDENFKKETYGIGEHEFECKKEREDHHQLDSLKVRGGGMHYFLVSLGEEMFLRYATKQRISCSE